MLNDLPPLRRETRNGLNLGARCSQLCLRIRKASDFCRPKTSSCRRSERASLSLTRYWQYLVSLFLSAKLTCYLFPVQWNSAFRPDIVKAEDRRNLDVWVPGDARNLEQTQRRHRVRPAPFFPRTVHSRLTGCVRLHSQAIGKVQDLHRVLPSERA